MKRVTILILGMLLIPMISFGQQWEFDSVFPDSSRSDRDVHGLAVDGEGKIWIQPYYPFTGDSVYVEQTGDSARVTVIQVYNPDGTEADFSPVKFLDFPDGTTDTVGGFWNGSAFEWKSGRGLETMPNGDIVATFFNDIYIINHETGAGIAKANGVENGLDTRGVIKPGVDGQGNVYISGVFPGDPVIIFDNELSYTGVAIDTTVGFSRGMEVSADGNTIYWAGYTNNALFRYQREDAFSGFNQVPDTLLKGMATESISFHPVSKFLYVSSGSSTNPPNQYPGFSSNYVEQKWYAFDPADLSPDNAVRMDSIAWNEEGSGPTEGRPRAIAFSNDGQTVYLGQFSQGAYATQQQSTDQVFTSNEREEVSSLPEGYELKQNYPNPFNPTTNINYSIAQAGFVSLTVYDMAGREVATLVNSRMSAGEHTVNFDASNLASGVYIYALNVNGLRMTNRMTLIK